MLVHILYRTYCVPGITVQQLGPLTYMIEVAAGKFWKRLVDYGKDYPSKGLSLAPESPETDNNENEIFAAPVKYLVKKTTLLVEKIQCL